MISICIITKDEMNNLEECLSRLGKLKYEIIVVDTGSTDGTKRIANKYTDKIFDFPWCDDFSAARNYSIAKASGDIVFIIDSDEFLVEFDKTKVEKLFNENPKIIGRIGIREKFGVNGGFESVDFVSRVFSKAYYHYEGRIHEQISSISNGPSIYENKTENTHLITQRHPLNIQTVNLPITVLHGGYGEEELRRKKANRNIELLMKELENCPDPYIFYQLGKSYYMVSEYDMACNYFSMGLEFDLDPTLEYVIDMVQTYGYSLINTKQYEAALQFENIYEEFGNTADFKFLMGLIYMNNGKFQAAVSEFEKATGYTSSKVEGVNTYLACYNIGVIYECLGQHDKAITCYKKCGDYDKAIGRLDILN